MRDPRLREYARILVDDCVGVRPGWQVLVVAQPSARPLVEEITRLIGERGAYALLRLRFHWIASAWAEEAPEDLLRTLAPIEAHAWEAADCYIAVLAPDNTRGDGALAPERVSMVGDAARPHTEPFTSGERPWVGCQYPTNALAQDANMSLGEFEEFLLGAVLIDWDALRRRMEGIAERFDAADEVRLLADGTDLRFSLAGRHGKLSAADANMPSGEVFYSPVEDSAEGTVHFAEYPAVYAGRQVEGVRLRFSGGRAVDASAGSEEDFLRQMLDRDSGARVLGEFGIGCNPGIQRHVRNTLFDEKMEGTIHLALGSGFAFIGGQNKSSLHWDMVKDLRGGGEIWCDGELVQKDGTWLL